MAKISVDQRVNANHTPGAIFHDTRITVDDVVNSPVIASPLHMLEIVMPVMGGAAVLVAGADLARRSRNRPVWIKGFGERVPYKTPIYAQDLLQTPMIKAAESAFSMAGLTPADMDMVSIYDCYTITALLSLEDAGFCDEGQGPAVRDRARPDVPRRLPDEHLRRPTRLRPGGTSPAACTTCATPPARSWAAPGATQVADCNRAFVSGNGGILSEQTTLVLEGD